MFREIPDKLAILGLGGNLGEVERTFTRALDSLADAGMKPVALSSLYRTKPEGCEEGAQDFLNAIAFGVWNDDAPALLALCKRLEEEAGRPSRHPHWVSRPLDLDIIAFGPREFKGEGLVIPHPLAAERDFVMTPLAEIAPELLLPGQKENAASIAKTLNLEKKQHIVNWIRKWGASKWTTRQNSALV